MRWFRQLICTHPSLHGREIAPALKSEFMTDPSAVLWRCSQCGKYWIKDGK
jgi:hypothetical protein